MRLNAIVMHKALLLSQGAGRPGRRAVGGAGGFLGQGEQLCKSQVGGKGFFFIIIIPDLKKIQRKPRRAERGGTQRKDTRGRRKLTLNPPVSAMTF